MQDIPLSIPLILRRAMSIGADMTVTSVEPAGIDRRTWAEVGDRSLRLASALETLGISPGATVASFAWNGHRHLELYYGAPCSGRVLHTINVRLHGDVIEYVVGHAGDEVIFVDASLTPTLAPLRDRLAAETFVVMEDGAEIDPVFADDPRYEDLIASHEPAEPAEVDENDAASICFTSGTTGKPKAVVYSHRSVVLHAMGELMVDGHAVRRGDVVLPLTPMFHVNCWGLPYAAGLAPASLVFAGADTSPPAAAALIEQTRPTVLAGIPTFWVQMDAVFASGDHDLGSVERILCGGAEAPPALIQKYTDRGIHFFHAWGMTEMSPSGTANWIPANSEDVEHGAKQGIAAPTVELRLMIDETTEAPWDGETVGELEARGPWVASSYFEPEDGSNEERFNDGWLRTGDVGRIYPDGTLEIVDRTKDLVKSGGEWISSVELERALASHPAVLESAVVAIPHEKWGERPAALVVLSPPASATADDLKEFLATKVATWQVPDVIEFVDELPKTGVGKIDKRRLRDEVVPRLGDGAEPTQS
jgi:fatty-acyl-CoA synthase